MYGTVKSSDALLVDGDQSIRRLHPKMHFRILRLSRIRVYEEKTEILAA